MQSKYQVPRSATDGHVFNRKPARDAAGEDLPILNRRLEVREGASNPIVNGGRDFTSLPDRHRWKYRIPSTSVVNKVGDCKLFLCCGWRLTAAQWIWILNLICFAAHTFMMVFTIWSAYFAKDVSKYEHDPYEVKIYRVSARWDNQSESTYEMTLEENGMPINLAWATAAFFGLSALAHLFAIVVGLFESTWFWYWRCVQPHKPTRLICCISQSVRCCV